MIRVGTLARRMIVLLVTFFMLCSATFVMGAEAEGEPQTDQAVKVLTRLNPPDNPLVIRPVGAVDFTIEIKEESLENQGVVPTKTRVRYDGGITFAAYECPIVWDYTSIDPNVAGLQRLVGRLAPVAGEAILSATLEAEVEHFVLFVGEGEPKEVTSLFSVTDISEGPYLLEQGGDSVTLDLGNQFAVCVL